MLSLIIVQSILSSIVKHRFHVWLQLQTLFFFQKPATEPDKVLQFTVTEDGARLGFPHLHHLPLLRPHQWGPGKNKTFNNDKDNLVQLLEQTLGSPNHPRYWLFLFYNHHFFRPENRTNSPVIHCQCYKYFYFNSNIFSTRIERATHQEHIQHLQLLLGEVGTSGGAVQAALLVCCLLLESCYIELNLILIYM